jgi:Holliday junction resolvase RusA-like endonuclease
MENFQKFIQMETVKLRFEIPGIPRSYAAAQKGKHGWFDPRFLYKQYVKWIIATQFKETCLPATTGLKAQFLFEMPIPKTISSARKKEILSGKVLHTTKPDIDNLIKLFTDCLKKIVINDDAQIVKYDPPSEKYYSQEPKTIIILREI